MAEPQVTSLASSGSSAVYLTLCVGPTDADVARARAVCADVPTLVRSVGRRDSAAQLSCVVAFGADAWERLVPGRGRPQQLHTFRPLADGPRVAPSTGGDVFLHVRAERRDFCHELVRLVMAKLGGSVRVADETHGFTYMDNRDLVGFVDGTENPEGDERAVWTIVGDEDPDHAGGTYVTVQRYVTDFAKWGSISTEEQEGVIGRTKADDVELDDDACPPSAHKARTTIERGDGEEQKIVRHNLAWGTSTEAGTFFIGYARDLSVTEEMLERMFVADAEGVYDRLLDFSVPVTGAHFFAPSLEVLEALADPVPAPAAETPAAADPAPAADGALGIGSLRR
jgi:porphyrinogen peroxidase